MELDITVFAMKNTDYGATIAERGDHVDFYDVLLRDEEGEIIEEVENIAEFHDAMAVVIDMEKRYPNAGFEEVGG